jgi:tRNA 2-thiouridine synthesizing protein E
MWGFAGGVSISFGNGRLKAELLNLLTGVKRHMSTQIPERDGDGYLLSMSDWTPEIGRAMAEADGVDLDDVKWDQILKAREYYEEENVVPPIRKFAKYVGQDQKEIFKMWKTGPMKPITKYGGLPKPTGCV